MNRLLNALAFAAVVIAAFVIESDLPQRVASSPLMAGVVSRVRCQRPARLVAPEGLPSGVEQASLERAMERMQVVQQRLQQVEMRRAAVVIPPEETNGNATPSLIQ